MTDAALTQYVVLGVALIQGLVQVLTHKWAKTDRKKQTEEITKSVEETKAEVVETKAEAKAAFKEANDVNVKILAVAQAEKARSLKSLVVKKPPKGKR
jgi:hypothetical protein